MEEPPQSNLDKKAVKILGLTCAFPTRKKINQTNTLDTIKEENEEEERLLEEDQRKPRRDTISAAEITRQLKELTREAESGIETAAKRRAILGAKYTELTEDMQEGKKTPEESATIDMDSHSDERASSEESENDEQELIEAQRQFTAKAVNLLKAVEDNHERHEKQMRELEKRLKGQEKEREVQKSIMAGLKNIGEQKTIKIKELQEKMQTANEQKTARIEELQERIRRVNMNRRDDLDVLQVRMSQELKQRDCRQEEIKRHSLELEEEISELKQGQKICQEQIDRLTERNIILNDRERKRKERMDKIKEEIANNNDSLTNALNQTTEPMEEAGIYTIDEEINERTWDQEVAQLEIRESQIEQKKKRIEYMKSGNYRRLETTKWPQTQEFTTHADFVQVIKNLTEKLINKGHPEDLIAEALDNSLNASKKTAKYMTMALRYDTSTLKGVLDALEACDITYMRTTGEERFNSTKKHSKEDWEGYMARCENLYDKMGNGDPNHSKARPRRIKEQFFKGANIEGSYGDKFMTMTDMDSVVAKVIEDEEEGRITYRGTEPRQGDVRTTGHTFNKRTEVGGPRGWKGRNISPNERTNSWGKDGKYGPKIHTIQQGEADNRGAGKKVPPGTRRAPNSRQDINPKDFCKRCRQMDHTVENCEFRRYCGYCEEQTGYGEKGHTNGMHVDRKSDRR